MSELGMKEFIGGTVGGIAQVLSGQPFDIIKVRQATSTTPLNAISAAMSMLKQEGLLSFWKGSSAPLIGVGACVSIQFGVLENSKKLVRNSKGKPLDTLDYIVCGSIAGMANSIVAAPAEHFRIRMQVQGIVDPRGDRLFKNGLDCITSIFKTQGIKGAYRGFLITLIREGASFGSYFGFYEYVVNYHLIPQGGTKKDVDLWKLFLVGGVSGY